MSKMLELPTPDVESMSREVEAMLALLTEAGRILAYVDGQLNIQTIPDTAAPASLPTPVAENR